MRKLVRNLLLGAGAILILAVFVIYNIVTNRIPMNPEGTVGNTAGNLNNRGLFCEYDGLVYFSNAYDRGALYSMTPDEQNVRKLGSVSVELLNAGGSFLFYFQSEASGSAGLGNVRVRKGIYRSRLNGRDATNFTSDTAFAMQLVDNYLYYLVSDREGPHFYKQKIDKSETVLLSDTQINPACVAGSLIYYNGTKSDHALYALNTLDDSIISVWNGNIWNPIVSGDYVYYMYVPNNYRLCRYSLSGNVIEVLTEDRIDSYNLTPNLIYYQKNSATDPCLMRMGLDGSNPEVVASGNYSDINATSRYVYFHPFETAFPVYRTPVDGPIQVEPFNAAMEAALSNAK